MFRNTHSHCSIFTHTLSCFQAAPRLLRGCSEAASRHTREATLSMARVWLERRWREDKGCNGLRLKNHAGRSLTDNRWTLNEIGEAPGIGCLSLFQICRVFEPKSTFFHFSRKKNDKHLVGSEKGRTFALAFGKQPGWNPRMHFYARFSKHETRSLTDCEQNRRQAARTHII